MVDIILNLSLKLHTPFIITGLIQSAFYGLRIGVVTIDEFGGSEIDDVLVSPGISPQILTFVRRGIITGLNSYSLGCNIKTESGL